MLQWTTNNISGVIVEYLSIESSKIFIHTIVSTAKANEAAIYAYRHSPPRSSFNMSDNSNNKGKNCSIFCVLGFVGKVTALVAVLVGIAIALVPRIIYTDLPAGLTFDLTKPTTIIVTGANSGLGLATCQHFAHNELATIIMACRSMTRCEQGKQQIYDNLDAKGVTVNADLRTMMLDLSDKSSIEAFAKELQGQPVHILINNAGLCGATPEVSYHEEDGVETHIRVNHLGHVYLAHCLWKNLQLADQARIVAVSSMMAAPSTNIPTKGWFKNEGEVIPHSPNLKMYGRSKRANLFFANELNLRYADDPNSSSISVVAAHPGFTHTDLCKNGCKGKKNLAKTLAKQQALIGIIKMSAEDGALSQAYAAVIPQAGVYIGPSLGIIGEPKIIGSLSSSWHHMPFSRDESKLLWDKSMEAMEIKVFGDYEIPADEEPEPPVTAEQQQEIVEEEEVASAKEETMPETEATAEEITKENHQPREEISTEAEEEPDDELDSDGNDEELQKILNTYLGDKPYRQAVIL